MHSTWKVPPFCLCMQEMRHSEVMPNTAIMEMLASALRNPPKVGGPLHLPPPSSPPPYIPQHTFHLPPPGWENKKGV